MIFERIKRFKTKNIRILEPTTGEENLREKTHDNTSLDYPLLHLYSL